MKRLHVGEIVVPRYENALGSVSRCIPITNTERGSIACAKKYRYKNIEGLSSSGLSGALAFGSCWHAFLEHYHNHYMGTDKKYVETYEISDVCLSAVHQVLDSAGDVYLDRIEYVERLTNLAEAWLDYYGESIPDQYDVIAAEIEIAVPVVDPQTGEMFKPKTAITEMRDADGSWYQIAKDGNSPHKFVRWPYYNFFTLDGLYRDKETGKIYIFEAKTASSPERRVLTATIDPQLGSYIYGVNQAIKMGLIPGLSEEDECVGYVFDCVGNKPQPSPKINKNGSMSKSVKPTSYMVRKWIDKEGLQRSDYVDQIMSARMEADPKWFQRYVGLFSREEQQRIAGEIWGISRHVSELRLRAVNSTTMMDMDKNFPRTPVCMGGYCQYKSICLHEDDYGRQNFELGSLVKWVNKNEDRSKEVFEW